MRARATDHLVSLDADALDIHGARLVALRTLVAVAVAVARITRIELDVVATLGARETLHPARRR
ncbi:MAG: hypothetical protein KA154_15585 [Gemmatimonadaceae bacterium]|nr:hypothetical protein [Gemmatimonadaceae bacterium]